MPPSCVKSQLAFKIVDVRQRGEFADKLHATRYKRIMTPAGLEPAIPGSVGRCLIHWATGPIGCQQYRTTFSIYSQAPAGAGKPEHSLSHPAAPRRPQAERSGSQKATTRPANHKQLFQTLSKPEQTSSDRGKTQQAATHAMANFSKD